MEANCLAVWKIGDLQAVDIYQYTISFMFEDKTKHQTWLLILNILRQISLNFQYYWKNMKLLSMGGGYYSFYTTRRKLALRVSQSLYILSERCCGLLIILITCSCTIKQKNEAWLEANTPENVISRPIMRARGGFYHNTSTNNRGLKMQASTAFRKNWN